MGDGPAAASFCHSCCEKAAEHLASPARASLLSALFRASVPSVRRPLLPLWLRLTWCSFVLLSSLPFDNRPLPRPEALEKARLSQEGGRQYNVLFPTASALLLSKKRPGATLVAQW